MGIYFFTLIITTFLAYISDMITKNRFIKNRYLDGAIVILLIVILSLISGLRYTTFYDPMNDESRIRLYTMQLQNTKINMNNISIFKEWGHYLINWIVANFTGNSQYVLLIYAFFTNFFMIKTIKKYAKPFWIGVFLYITGGFFFSSINIMAQCLAASIIANASKYIVERKKFRYLLCVVIAASIHMSAYIALPIYYLSHKEIKMDKAIKYSVIGIFAAYLFIPVSNLLLKNTPYYYYLDTINDGYYGMNPILVLIWGGFFLFILYFSRRIKVEFVLVYRNFTFFMLIVSLLSVMYIYIDRINYYFAISYIVLLPTVLSNIRKWDRLIYQFIILSSFVVLGIITWSKLNYYNIIFELFR